MTTTVIHSVPRDLDEIHLALIGSAGPLVPDWDLNTPMRPGAVHLMHKAYVMSPGHGGGVSMYDRGTGKHTSVTMLSFDEACGTVAARLASSPTFVSQFLTALCERVHADNVAAGWWSDVKTKQSTLHTRNVPEMLCLIHSEISEAMEGYRKRLMDDKLPDRPMLQTELIDALIRIFDLLGSRMAIEADLRTINPDVRQHRAGEIFMEKRAYNAQRADHKPENRVKPGGKAF